MTASNEEQRRGKSVSPWQAAIKDRLATFESMPVDMTALEARITSEIPRATHATAGLRKRTGCATSAMIAIGLLFTGLAWATAARGAHPAGPVDKPSHQDIGRTP